MSQCIHEWTWQVELTGVSSNPNSTTNWSCDLDQMTYSTWNVLFESGFNIILKGLEDQIRGHVCQAYHMQEVNSVSLLPTHLIVVQSEPVEDISYKHEMFKPLLPTNPEKRGLWPRLCTRRVLLWPSSDYALPQRVRILWGQGDTHTQNPCPASSPCSV